MRAGQAARRFQRALSRNGVEGVVRLAVRRARQKMHSSEDHVWYRLVLDGASERTVPLAEGLGLVQALPEQVGLVDALGQNPIVARQHLALGHEVYLVLEDERPLFACRIYRGRAPMIAAHGGWLDLPDGVVVLEDSVAAPEARGRGIAPAVWSQLAAQLEREGLESLITKVGVENEPSRRAVLKAGFGEIALMHYRHSGAHTRVTLEQLADDDPVALELTTRLTRG